MGRDVPWKRGAVWPAAGIVPGQQLRQAFARERPRLPLVEHDDLWVNRQRMEVLAHESETEAVQRGNLRGVEQGGLFGEVRRKFGSLRRG